jgi:hypothetical protein
MLSTALQFRGSAGLFAVRAAPARRTSVAVYLLAILALTAASCTRHKTRVFVRPPSQIRPVVLPSTPELPEPPEVSAKSDSENPPETYSTIPVLPPPPPPVRRPPVVASPRPTPPPVAVEPPANPRLGQIFTADQLRDYNRAFDDSMARVRTILAVAAGRKLTSQQTGIVARVRTFMQQAEQARQQDLVTAVGLARRADLLAQDLSASLP